MLRPTPSLISLTSTDIADFEHRFRARQQYARFLHDQDPRMAGVRISPGPSRHASLHCVPKEQLAAGAVGSLSRAASGGGAQVAALGGEAEKSEAQVRMRAVSHGNPVGVDAQDVVPENASSAAAHVAAAIRSRQALTDGCPDEPLPTTPAQRPDEGDLLPSRRGLEPLEEIIHDGYPSSAPRRPIPSLLSSARARRRNARSHDTSIAEDGAEIQEAIRTRHLQRIPNGGVGGNIPPPPVPELMLPEDLQHGPDLRLHSSAPVFVPRTRFGTVADPPAESDTVGREPRWSSLDSTHSNTNLRLRSSSEQNVDLSARTRAPRREDLLPRHRRRSRASDQNEAIPNLERYPLLRPPPRLAARRRNSGSQRAVHMPGRRLSRVVTPGSSSSPLPPLLSGVSVTVEHGNSDLVPAMDGTAQSRASTASGSTSSSIQIPHSEPRLRARSSSLNWRDDTSSPASTRRVPSMVSAASGISGVASSQRASSGSTDAIAEFLRMRNSPLDELTERLSRLAANRPRSVGHSWERTPGSRARVSLLNGDPFQNGSSSPPLLADEVHTGPNVSSLTAGRHAAVGELAGPPSSPPRVPATTPIASPPPQAISSPRRPLKDMSPAKTAASQSRPAKFQPVASAAATPKVKVFDDTKPAATQPRTPADIPGSSRRARIRSDTAVHAQQQHSVVSPSTMSLPQIPERNNNRHTYPSNTPESAGRTQIVQIDAVLGSVARPRARRGTRTQQRSTSGENDVDSQLRVVEGDRQTWLHTREHGSLEDTPPAEGRYEQFLE